MFTVFNDGTYRQDIVSIYRKLISEPEFSAFFVVVNLGSRIMSWR